MKYKGFKERSCEIFSYGIIIFVLFDSCADIQTDTIKLFHEKHRPQIHFSPESHWMNDPNGLVYYKGEYHMFYQHFPDSNVWGPMHWGHAISTDLVYWKHLPIALYPDSLGYIFSGSVVVDELNTSGLGTSENPPLVALFTYHNMKKEKEGAKDFQYQGLAFSIDSGRSWQKYKNNPILFNLEGYKSGIVDFRDPKVFWYPQDSNWVMSLAIKDHIGFYVSKNLIDWTKTGDFGFNLGAHGGVWECPDLFPIEDDLGTTKWVLIVSINPGGPQGGSATQYFLGQFNGEVFTEADTVTRWLDWGTDNYAGVTFSGLPNSTDKRRIFLGWMSNWLYAQFVPTEVWRSAMTIPRYLLLDNNILVSKPVDEFRKLRISEKEFVNAQIEDSINFSNPLQEIIIELDSNMEHFQFEIGNTIGQKIVFTLAENLTIDRSQSGEYDFSDDFANQIKMPLFEKCWSLQLFLDVASFELFINDGQYVATGIFFPDSTYSFLKIKNEYNQVRSIKLFALDGIWQKQNSK